MVLDNTNKTYEIFKKTIDSEETIIDTGLKYKVKKVSDEVTDSVEENGVSNFLNKYVIKG